MCKTVWAFIYITNNHEIPGHSGVCLFNAVRVAGQISDVFHLGVKLSGTAQAELLCVHEPPPKPWSAGDPSPRQTSIGKISDSVMKSERGVLVRGSDPPSGHSSPHTRAGWFSRKRNGIHPSGTCISPTKKQKRSREGSLTTLPTSPTETPRVP